jgi:hypothetical protein
MRFGIARSVSDDAMAPDSFAPLATTEHSEQDTMNRYITVLVKLGKVNNFNHS